MTIPIGSIRDTQDRADSGAVSRGDWVRYINGGNVERRMQVHTLGPSPLNAPLDLVAITWDIAGSPTVQLIANVPSALTVGSQPYWTT